MLRGHRRSNARTIALRRLGCLCILIVFLLGPAAGVAPAIHLAHSGHDHHRDECPVCVQLAVKAAAPVVERPALFAPAENPLFQYPFAAQVLALSAYEHAPLAARAPPTVG